MSITPRERIVAILNQEQSVDIRELLQEYAKDKNIEDQYVDILISNPIALKNINIKNLMEHFKIKHHVCSIISNNKLIKHY